MARPRSENPSKKALAVREWYERTREQRREYARAWRERNLEKSRERDRLNARKYREANPEKAREAMRRVRKKNPARVRELIAASKAKKPAYYREMQRKAETRYREMHPERPFTDALRRSCATVGITLVQYYEILDEQGGVCRICKNPPTTSRLYLDHCHSGGIFRGLLCRECNSGLGQFRDNPEILRAAAEYLERHK